jgi:hypothetical protein
MRFAAVLKVVKSRLRGADLFLCQFSAAGTLNDVAEDAKEPFDSAMTVCEHSNRIIEPAIRLRPYLYSHAVSFFLFVNSCSDS